MPRCEKKIHDNLLKQGIESFLPLQSVIKFWSDRKKRMDVPLFPSYVFIRLSERMRHHAFAVSGVLSYVVSEGKPCIVSEDVIQNIRIAGANNPDVVNIDECFWKGEKLRVTQGPLRGVTGELVEIKGKSKLLIRVESVQRCLMIEVPKAHLIKQNSETSLV